MSVFTGPLRLALLALDVAPWRAWACWAGVRIYSTLYRYWESD